MRFVLSLVVPSSIICRLLFDCLGNMFIKILIYRRILTQRSSDRQKFWSSDETVYLELWPQLVSLLVVVEPSFLSWFHWSCLKHDNKNRIKAQIWLTLANWRIFLIFWLPWLDLLAAFGFLWLPYVILPSSEIEMNRKDLELSSRNQSFLSARDVQHT